MTRADRQAPPVKRTSRFTAALLIATSLALASILAELVLRIPGVRPPLQNEFLMRYPDSRVPNDHLVITRPELLDSRHYAKIAGRRTIIALGDSFTRGVPAAAPDSYPAVLERLLGNNGSPSNVINAGVGDSGPDQHLRLLPGYILRHAKPAIVIWTFYFNDVYDNWAYPLFFISEDRLVAVPNVRSYWLNRRHRLLRASPVTRAAFRHSMVLRLLLKFPERRPEPIVPTGPVSNRDQWSLDKIRLAAAEFHQIGRNNDFRTYLVLIAPEARYLAGTGRGALKAGKDSPPQLRCAGESLGARTLPEWRSSEHVKTGDRLRAVLETQPGFIDAWFPEADSQAIYAGPAREPEPAGNRHFNEAGYAMLAEKVAARILSDDAKQAGTETPHHP